MTHHIAINADEALKNFRDLLSQSTTVRERVERIAPDFSDTAFGRVHQEKTRRLREALLKVHQRNQALAAGLVDISQKGIDQVRTFADTDSGNAVNVATVGNSLKGDS